VSRASDIEGLEKDCASAYAERVKGIKRITRETKAFVGDSKKEREAMASALHKKIDAEEAARKRQAKADGDVRVAADKKLKADTRKMVNQMDADTKAMASALHKKIDAEEAARKSQAKADGDVRVAADKKLKADTRKMVAGFKAESDASGKAWGTLVKTMAEKRQGTAKKPAAKKKAGPVGDEAKIMTVVKAKPGGVKLVEIESETGIARIKAARVLKELIDSGRITKEELLYKLS
jgi:membrane protein involved in colicin uptake